MKKESKKEMNEGSKELWKIKKIVQIQENWQRKVSLMKTSVRQAYCPAEVRGMLEHINLHLWCSKRRSTFFSCSCFIWTFRLSRIRRCVYSNNFKALHILTYFLDFVFVRVFCSYLIVCVMIISLNSSAANLIAQTSRFPSFMVAFRK